MTLELAIVVGAAFAALWYYARVRLIRFTEPERDNLVNLGRRILAHPSATDDDRKFVRQLAEAALSPVLAWTFSCLFIVYAVRSLISASYRRKLDADIAGKNRELVKMLGGFVQSLMRSVYSTAPLAWVVFRIALGLSNLGILMGRRSTMRSIERVRDRVIVFEERAMLNQPFSFNWASK